MARFRPAYYRDYLIDYFRDYQRLPLRGSLRSRAPNSSPASGQAIREERFGSAEPKRSGRKKEKGGTESLRRPLSGLPPDRGGDREAWFPC